MHINLNDVHCLLQGFQMLCHAPCLSSTTYLDLSYQSDLSDSDITVILSRCSQSLRHMCLRGTQLGPMGLMMLGTQVRLQTLTANGIMSWC